MAGSDDAASDLKSISSPSLAAWREAWQAEAVASSAGVADRNGLAPGSRDAVAHGEAILPMPDRLAAFDGDAFAFKATPPALPPPWRIVALLAGAGDAEAMRSAAAFAMKSGAGALRLSLGASSPPWRNDRALQGDLVGACGGALSFDGDVERLAEAVGGFDPAGGVDEGGAGLRFDLDPFRRADGGVADLSHVLDVGATLGRRFPQARLYAVSHRACPAVEGDGVGESAVILSAAAELLRAAHKRSLPLDSLWRRLRPLVSIDHRFVASLAKLRALTIGLSAIGERCGIATPANGAAIFVHERILAAREPWNNLTRLTIAAVAAIVAADADEIVLPSPRAAIGDENDNDRRLARNILSMLHYEGGLTEFRDPARGAAAIEAATQRFVDEAWKRFRAVEAQGGLSVAQKAGTLADIVVGDAADLTPQIGVTRFAESDERLEPHERPRTSAPPSS